MMEDPKFFYKLQKGKQARGIIARVIRKWPFHGTGGQSLPLHVGMVLADGKGEAMYAQIDSQLIETKAKVFQIGKVYIIKRFTVDNAKGSYRAVDRDLMITITQYTSAEIMTDPPDTIPHLIYNITVLASIKPTEVIYMYTDVIGYLIKYEALHTFVPKNKEKAKMLREIYIKDLRDNVMKITLWGDQAADFNINDIYDEEVGNLIVCLVLGCTPRKDFKNRDKTALTGSAACSYYFNPPIPEAAPFHNKFQDTPVYIERPLPSEEAATSTPQDIQLPQKTIAELTKVDPFDEEEQGPFKCIITISSIVNTKSWWYMSCTACKKSAEQQLDRSYKCPKCHTFDTMPRYTLTFMGKDETGEARFFAYDDEAQQMIQKECQSIMVSIQGRDGLPQAIQNIINKTFVFSVNLSDDSCKGDMYRQYQIKAVLERPIRRGTPHNASSSRSQLIHVTPTTTPPHHQAPPLNTETDEIIEKNDSTRLPTNESSARRNLLPQLEEATKTTDINANTSDTDNAVLKSPTPPQPKRAKKSADKGDQSKPA